MRRGADGLAYQGMLPKLTNEAPETRFSVTSSGESNSSAAGLEQVGERAVTGLVDLHEGERGARGLRLAADTRCLPLGLQRPQDEVTEEVLPTLPTNGPRRRAWRRRPPRSPARRRAGYEPQLDVRELTPPVDVRRPSPA